VHLVRYPNNLAGLPPLFRLLRRFPMANLGVALEDRTRSVHNYYKTLRVLLRFSSFVENAVFLVLSRRRRSTITIRTSYREDILKRAREPPYMRGLAYYLRRRYLV